MLIENKLLKYFKGDELASFVWESKYKFKDEQTPNDMFIRHATEIGQTEIKRISKLLPKKLNKFQKLFIKQNEIKFDLLSDYGKRKYHSLVQLHKNPELILDVFVKLCNYSNIVLAGSFLQGIGRHEFYSSLSNCFVLGQPYDSYSGINEKGKEITEVMKRRGGAGLDLSTIRPAGSAVHNQSTLSSGVVLFAEGYSSKTKEVAQYGRRGALMLTLSIKHPDSVAFAKEKQDLSKITGANISLKMPNDFMLAVKNDEDYFQCFPINKETYKLRFEDFEYNKLIEIKTLKYTENIINFFNLPQYVKKVKARDVWKEITKCAWTTAEPGLVFEDNWITYGLDGIYEQYRPISTNPCSEIPMQAYDACRLLSKNLYSLISEPFTENASIDYVQAYNMFYEQLVIGDILIDLEMEYIDRIINKIKNGKDPQELKDFETGVWEKIKTTALKGRRCGAGFIGLGDMLAAINENYYSPEIITKLFKIKMQAELDATIDLSILYGSFDGFDSKLESSCPTEMLKMIKKEFPHQFEKMMKYGRRNVSWSTAAPTGSLSIQTQTTSGIEPLFLAYYMRRKKCIDPSERIDYVDPADGQKFTEYPVLHPKFVEWFKIALKFDRQKVESFTKADLDYFFKKSPWYGNCANDLNWEQRVEIQSIVQKYTTHAISSTINLPKDCSIDLIGDIYMKSWESGLKGNTVYREGSRGGILVNNNDKIPTKFEARHAPKRPRTLPAIYHTLKYRNKTYSVVIGFFNGFPHEVFVISGLDNLPQNFDENDTIKGYINKEAKDWYNFESETFLLKDISAIEKDEKLVSLMLSGLLRHGAPLKYVIKTLNKTNPIAGSFTHKLIKIISKYLVDINTGDLCPECQTELKHENGCISCPACGWSKC